MFSDAVATILVHEWPLQATYFDGEHLDGPVPRLFTANLEEAKTAFTSNLSNSYKVPSPCKFE